MRKSRITTNRIFPTYQLPEKVRAAHILFKTEGSHLRKLKKLKSKQQKFLIKPRRELISRNWQRNIQRIVRPATGDLECLAEEPWSQNLKMRLSPWGPERSVIGEQSLGSMVKVLEKQAAHTQSLEEASALIVRLCNNAKPSN
jgi:hypothetical protein